MAHAPKPISDTLYPVFYLSNDERLVDRENRPLPMDQGLDREVLTSRRGLVTDDYERECRSRGKLPEENTVKILE